MRCKVRKTTLPLSRLSFKSFCLLEFSRLADHTQEARTPLKTWPCAQQSGGRKGNIAIMLVLHHPQIVATNMERPNGPTAAWTRQKVRAPGGSGACETCGQSFQTT